MGERSNSSLLFSPNRPKALIRLLDNSAIEITLHSRLSVEDALSVIASKCEISNSDSRLFSLGITDDSGDFHWLESSLILRDLAAASVKVDGYLLLSHHVRFFVDTITEVQSVSTAQFYFLEVQNQLARHELIVTNDDYVDMMAILISLFVPDCQEDTISEAVSHFMPNSHPPSILMKNKDVEKAIYERLQSNRNIPRGAAIMKFLKIAEKSESYGYRMYELLNDEDEKVLLSIGAKGILIYRRMKNRSLITPIMSFHWKYIDNLYYREAKFSIEIRPPKRNEINSSPNKNEDEVLAGDSRLEEAFNHPTTQIITTIRRNGTGHRPHIFNFTCSTALLCRTVWSAAIAQHQFFLEQKTIKKKSHRGASTTGVHHQELVDKLNRLTSSSSLGSSLPSLSSLRSTTSSSIGAMPSAKIGDTSVSSLPSSLIEKSKNKAQTSCSSFHKKTPDEINRDRERYEKCQQRLEELNELLAAKMKELLETCIEEGEITGVLPDEIALAVQPGEETPRLKRRVGTAYSIPDDLIKADKSDKMSQLETDVELHRRIVAAASRLATDKSTNKSVRKKRLKDLQAARQKLNRLEQGLQQMRYSASKPDISSIASDGSGNSWKSAQPMLTMAMTKSCPTTPRGSVPDLSRKLDDDKSEMEDEISRRAPSAISRTSLQQRYSGISSTSSGAESGSSGLPPRPNSRKTTDENIIDKENEMGPKSEDFCDELNPLYENVGYRSTSYRSSYRQAHYPTIHDEHNGMNGQQRKRAQSAHTLENGSRTCTYSVPFNDAAAKMKDEEQKPEAIVTPAVRRLSTSVSCHAGFTTSSLDRRYVRKSAEEYSGTRTARVTTFPVAPPSTTVILSGKPYSASELSRCYQGAPPVARINQAASRGSLPPSYSTATAKMGMSTNPQMEALLFYYKQQQNKQQHPNGAQISSVRKQPKTATIV